MGKNGDWKSEGYKIKVDDKDDGFFRVNCFSPSDELVGHANFKISTSMKDWTTIVPDPTKLEVCTVQVNEDHQRKGLASEMYRLIEDYTGAVVLNGIGTILQTAEAKAFWKSRS